MAINTWKIWVKLGIVKPKKEIVQVGKDITAVLRSVKEVTPIIRKLLDYLLEMRRLHEEEVELKKKNASADDLKLNLEEQVQVYDKILELYEFYQMEVDVNGARVKKVSRELGRRAKDEQIAQRWLDKIRKSEKWTFNW